MNVAECYSGSDKSGFVPNTLDRIIERTDKDLVDASDVVKLRKCLQMESNKNWQSYIKGFWGLLAIRNDLGSDGESLLMESINGFDILARDFFETSNIYCQACYEIGMLLFEKEEYQEATSYFLRCLPGMIDVFSEIYIGNIFMALDVCFSFSEMERYSFVFAENAVMSARNCDRALEGLMINYFNEGRIDDAKRVFSLIMEEFNDEKFIRGIKDYAEEHF